MPRDFSKSESAEWASVRPAVNRALGTCRHRNCFIDALQEALERGHGKVALVYRNGEPVAVLRMVEARKGPVGDWTRGRLKCQDADLRGVDDLVFDGLRYGELEIPADASARRKGNEISVGASAYEIGELLREWREAAEEWSAKPGAGGALVVMVKDGRLAWGGVDVRRGPSVPIPGIPRQRSRRA